MTANLPASIANNATLLAELKNQTGSCLLPGGVAIPLQIGTEFQNTGCILGFLCKNNTIDNPPNYCPPHPICAVSRLHGGSCPEPQGFFEPQLCPSRFYCPKGGKEQIICPAGFYCPRGSVEPLKCGPVAQCPEGSMKSMSFLPLGILIVVDVLLITLTILDKLRTKYKRRGLKGPRVNKKALLARGAGRFQGNAYQELENNGFDHNDYQMQSRITSMGRRPTGFEQLGASEAAFLFKDQQDDGSQKTDLHLFVESLSKCLGATKFGLSFEFQDLAFRPPKSSRKILSEVSGTIHAGSLWGVMGASGAGKSTFVNVLMGKQSNTGGVTKVNGVAGKIAKYKKIIGYVPQDDTVLPELTVRENILHSARIRLPCTWSDKEIQNHVDILISCLQLAHVQDSLVGSTAAPVISGGQRKRVSIGMELAAAPMALFLDEPTSGLDATAAASIMSTLKALSRLGMTIVTIIHQPRQEIFESLDSLVLLGQGRMIYCGAQIDMQPHFEGIGYQFPPHSNPADVMGDIIAGEGKSYKRTGDSSVEGLIQYWSKERKDSLAPEQDKVRPVSMIEINSLAQTLKIRGAQWYKQIYYCLSRSLLQQYRMKSSFFFEIGVGALAGFLIGLSQLSSNGQNFRGIYHSPYEWLSSSADYASVAQMSLLVGLAIGLTASAPGVKIFGEEKLVYWREAAAGHNRFAYYTGKVLSTFPRMIIANFHFTTLFMLLTTPRITYISAFTANMLYFYCIYGLASVISMITRREDGPLLAVMLSLIVGVLNGMSPTLKRVRIWKVIWIWRASPGTWLSEAYFSENVLPLEYLYRIEIARDNLGYELGVFGTDLFVLFAIGTVYRVVAFLGLRFMWRDRQR
ncbi:hypothetical protein VTL71DRAFT_16154 [Oculimacula yallundae]|uniref:ABC transporter domain-containing protein n=1 Tax=Oculimacula yallundae TaxID=86028 RepID=A0ABR4CFQ9_9HELO